MCVCVIIYVCISVFAVFMYVCLCVFVLFSVQLYVRDSALCLCVSSCATVFHGHPAVCNAALTQRGAVCDQDVCGVGDLVPLVQQSLTPGQVEAPAVVPGLPAGGDRGTLLVGFNYPFTFTLKSQLQVETLPMA